jgi:hypothetical protein
VTLELEKHSLAIEARRVAPETPVRGHHTMAWDHDRHGVGSHGPAHRSSRATDRPGERPVAGQLAVSDFHQPAQHAASEGSSKAEINRQVKLSCPAPEIPHQRPDPSAQLGVLAGDEVEATAEIGERSISGTELDAADPIAGRRYQKLAERGIEDLIRQLGHGGSLAG